MTFSLATDREALKLQDFLFLLGFLLGFVYKISRHQKLLYVIKTLLKNLLNTMPLHVLLAGWLYIFSKVH